MNAAAIAAFAQVVLIDLVLAGDNAVVLGILAAALPAAWRGRAMFWGIVLAILARVALSLGIVWVLNIPGAMLIGGILLLWVAWKMFRDIRNADQDEGEVRAAPGRGFFWALLTIVAADLSMSLDNVLGVAGAARQHWEALVFGLVLSMALMGGAATIISSLIGRHRWIAWIGLVLVLFVAVRMILAGIPQL